MSDFREVATEVTVALLVVVIGGASITALCLLAGLLIHPVAGFVVALALIWAASFAIAWNAR